MNNATEREKRVIMESTFRAVLMNGEKLDSYYLNDKGYVDVGGFEVCVPEYKESIPFDFEATAKSCNDDGTYSYGNWDGFLERIYDVDPCHEEVWAENGLTKEDITAKLLASAERLEEFYFNVCDKNDRMIPCFLEVLSMEFWDEKDNYHAIDTNVLQNFNRLRVAEQIAELMQPKTTYRERIPLMEEFIKSMQNENPNGVLGKITSIQNASFYRTEKRALCDFLIDSMLEVSASKEQIYRVGLTAYGNPDHGENPCERLSDVEARYTYKASIKECQEEVSIYIEKHNLGSGNWCGGMVFKSDEYVGSISYNGRFWDKESKYGSLSQLLKTDIPQIDSEICGYGKNLFQKDLSSDDKSLENKINKIGKSSKEKKVRESRDLEL